MAIPTAYVGRCKLYSDSTHAELIEEVPNAGLIGPRCQNCKMYDDRIMNPALHVVNLYRCPQLDLVYVPSKSEFENFLAEHYGSVRELDPEEMRKDALKRMSRLPPIDFIPP